MRGQRPGTQGGWQRSIHRQLLLHCAGACLGRPSTVMRQQDSAAKSPALNATEVRVLKISYSLPNAVYKHRPMDEHSPLTTEEKTSASHPRVCCNAGQKLDRALL